MMTDRELLELIAAQVGALTSNVGTLTSEVGTLTTNVEDITKEVSELKEGQNKIESELGNVKRITLNMEQSHGKQLVALFDVYSKFGRFASLTKVPGTTRILSKDIK